MLEAGKIDLAALGAPFSYRLKARGTARPLFPCATRWARAKGWSSWRAPGSSQATAPRSPISSRIISARCAGSSTPAHRDEAVQIVASFTRAPRALYDDYLFTDGDYYRDRDARPDLAALQRNMDALRDAGFLDIAIDVRHYVDLESHRRGREAARLIRAEAAREAQHRAVFSPPMSAA